MKEIYQKRGQEIRSYKIIDDGLEAEIQINGELQAFNIQFEEIDFIQIISNKKVYQLELGLFISIVFNLLFILILVSDWLIKITENEIIPSTIAFGVIAVLTPWSITLFKTKKELILKGTQNLFFFYNQEEIEKVNDFVKSLKYEQKEYIRKKYMLIDELIPHETQEQTFYWLYNKKFITRSELEIMLDNLDNRRLIEGK